MLNSPLNLTPYLVLNQSCCLQSVGRSVSIYSAPRFTGHRLGNPIVTWTAKYTAPTPAVLQKSPVDAREAGVAFK